MIKIQPTYYIKHIPIIKWTSQKDAPFIRSLGSNATGKTSVGKMLMKIFNFMSRKNLEQITDGICDITKEASFSIDLVSRDSVLFRLETLILPALNQEYKASDIKVRVQSTNINKSDSYEKCIQRFSIPFLFDESNYAIELEKISNSFGWLFAYPTDNSRINHKEESKNYLTILTSTLRALDSSIETIEKIESVDNSYIIKTKQQDLIVQDGQVIKES